MGVVDLSQRYKPTVKQAIAHTAKERYLLFGGSVGCGKSVFLVNEGLQLSLDSPGNRGYLARWENRTFKNTTLLTMQQYIPQELIKRVHLGDQYFDLINGSRIYYGGLKPSGGSDPLTRLGSMELGWVGLDETCEIPEDMFLFLCSRLRMDLAAIRYRVIMASNPTAGWLKTRFVDQDLPDHRFVNALPRDNPHLPSDYELRLRALFPKEWVEQYLEGNWDVLMEGNFIFPYMHIKAAVERELAATEDITGMGFDIGGGRDETIGVGRWGPVIRMIHKSRFRDTMRTTGEIAAEIVKYSPPYCNIDAIGIGKGPYDRLKEQGYNVFPYIAGATPLTKEKDGMKFRNRKAEDHWNFRIELENGEVDLEDDQKLISQLAGITYKIESDRTIAITSKDEVRAMGKASPDRAEAAIIASAKSKKRIVGRMLNR